MIKVRKASDRGHVKFGWLDAKHTFSFGHYFDPAHMGFRSLRVINNDIVSAGMGFDTHPHKDMEIITFIIEGELEHKDTLGNNSIIKTGEIQIMSAGSGIYHSEYNPSAKLPTTLYQIWIKPNALGISPRYEQYSYLDRIKINDWIDLVNSEGADGIAKIYQEATVRFGSFKENFQMLLNLSSLHGYWIQVIKGDLKLNGTTLSSSDGVSIEEESVVNFEFNQDTELLLFELK
jgi:quercetin 2,3-dioxygenase